MMFEILSVGGGVSLQDGGRRGWRAFGVPPGGAMDARSACLANRLVGNEDGWPVLEFFHSGARLRAGGAARVALTGTERRGGSPAWRSFAVDGEDLLEIGSVVRGVWTYLAVAGGFLGPCRFGSAGVSPRAGLGNVFRAGDRIESGAPRNHPGVADRFVRPEERWMAREGEPIPLWPGPEWSALPEAARMLLTEEWKVSDQVDRMGTRLAGSPLPARDLSLSSAPVRPGTVQVPPSGQPIVLLRDGPTVGGYPRLALIEPGALDRFAQISPGGAVRFCRAPSANPMGWTEVSWI